MYSNFIGKEQSFTELMADRGADRVALVAQTLQEARDRPGGDPPAEFGHMLVAIADKDIAAAALQTEFWLHAVRNPDTVQTLAEGTSGTLDRLREVLAAVLALFHGLIRQRRIDPRRRNYSARRWRGNWRECRNVTATT